MRKLLRLTLHRHLPSAIATTAEEPIVLAFKRDISDSQSCARANSEPVHAVTALCCSALEHQLMKASPFAGRQVGHVASQQGFPDVQDVHLDLGSCILQALEEQVDGKSIRYTLACQAAPILLLHFASPQICCSTLISGHA